MTPTPALFERHAKRLYKRHEARLSRERRDHLEVRDRSMVEDSELRGGLDVQHRPLFFVDLRVIAPDREQCERIASELRAEEAENRLVERGTAVRHGLLGLYTRRVQRGEGNPLPSFHKGVFASTELAAIWHLPSIDYATVPFARGVLPAGARAAGDPAPRRRGGHAARRARAGVDPSGDAQAEHRRAGHGRAGQVQLSGGHRRRGSAPRALRGDRARPQGRRGRGGGRASCRPERTCTLLDLAHPTCGFNPLAVDAPADVIADYVVAALKNLFHRRRHPRVLGPISAQRDHRGARLRPRLDAVGRGAAAVGRRGGLLLPQLASGARVRALPEFKEISEFFTAELTAQLADARSMTTAKLDAPVNKLARLLNSPSIKRVLLNDSLRVDFDRVIAGRRGARRQGRAGRDGRGEHLRADAAARRHARRGARPSAGSRAGRRSASRSR